jgi:hypothetical protein
MRFLPFEDFEVHTTMSSNEVFYRLRASVDTQRKWLIFTNKPFWGLVHRKYFRIRRDTWWNHNVTPVVFGKVNLEDSGCCIRIKMRMPWLSFLFDSLVLGWLWVMYFGGIANLIVEKIRSGIWQIDSPGMLLPGVGMFAFVYLISVGAFKSEVRRIKSYLLSLWQANEENIIVRDQIFGLTEPQFIKSLFLLTLVISLTWIVFSVFWEPIIP